jgi:dimethylglycine catabolism A
MICIVGACPAGLTFASLVADRNRVTVLERAPVSGGAFRYTGKGPPFGEVEAAEESFGTYVAELERACRDKGVGFRHGVDVTEAPQALAPYDRVVFATGPATGTGWVLSRRASWIRASASRSWDGGCSPRRAYETGSTTGLDGEPEKTCGGSPGPTKRSWSSATQPKPARPGTP